ncbi:PDZ domain [Phytophthora cactorum]|nr:PDZ domain [Phytophthora cactorum]
MAARLVQPHAPTDAEQMQDYLINWNAGPLGMLPQPSVLKMAGVREGDLLISVNGKKTTRLGYEKVVRLLFKERLPMVLHFRSPLQVPEMQRGVSGAIAEEPASGRGGRSRTSSSARPSQQSKSRSRGRSDVDVHAQIEQKRNPNVQNFRIDSDVSTKSARPSQQSKSRSRGRSDVDLHAQIEQKRNPNVQNFSIDSDVSTKSEKKKSKRKHKHKHGDKAEAEERRLRKQYSVVWERGSLGISFRAYNSKVNVPCVDFISASRGLGRGMDRVCVNDVLIAINGEKTKALGVEKVLRWLHVVEKPVVLRFHASSNRILNPAGGLLPQLADEDVEASERPRRPTMPLPLPQPEYEPPPRPPRRNNSVDQPMPQQRMERGYSDDREYELQPAVAPRRYSRDSATYFEKQPIEEYDMQYQFGASKIEVKERRYSKNSMNAYAHGHDEDGVAGDFRREPKDADAHRRLQQSEDRISQPQLQLPPSRTRTSSASRDDIRRQQLSENKPAPPSPPTDAAARPRLASRDSQVSNSSQLSFDEATGVVARAAGKPKEECEFGGVPLLDIKEGTVQAKLMYIYAKACLAKEGSSDDEPASKDPQPSLTLAIHSDDAVASNHIPSQRNDDACHEYKVDHEELKLEEINDVNNSHELKRSGIFSDNLDESFAKMQKDISIQQSPPPVVTLPLSSAGPSSSVSSDATPTVTPTLAPVTPAEDFISLKDFLVKGDGSLTERHTTSSTATPVLSTDGGETDKTDEQHDTQSTVVKPEETIVEASSELMMEELKSSDLKEDSSELVLDELKSTEPKEASVEQEEESTEEPAKIAKLEEEHTDENLHEDDDVASVDSSNERDLAASVASLDDLLDLKDGNHDDEEHEEFVDDDDEEQENEKNEKSHADEKESMNTSLGMKLDQREKDQEHAEHDDDTEYEDGALSNPLVDELFRTIPDVRHVIKDKPALMVLVKKTMIDEIQEILQSLQMELQFERHSTMAVGSTASPLRESQQGRSTEGEHCYRCGATGELAELDVAGGQRELYCQECWELFFFSEDRQSPMTRTSKTLAPSEAGRLTADEDALDEALKYSFHDSSVTREDMIHPWRYLQGSDSISSSIRDSNDSSITDRADEVWL